MHNNIGESFDRVLAGLDPRITLADNRRCCRAGKRYCALTEGTCCRESDSSSVLLLEFWDGGVVMGQCSTASLESAARALHSWVARALPLGKMKEAHPEFRTLPDAWGFEQGDEVEQRWQDYLQNSDEWPHMAPFLEAAAANPTLRGLFPFFSMQTLRFSLCTDFPYRCLPPKVRAFQPGRFQVNQGDTLLGIGDANQAIAIVLRHLPPAPGRAVRRRID